MEETTVRNGRKGEGDGGNGNRILEDERKERLGAKRGKKGTREGKVGKWKRRKEMVERGERMEGRNRVKGY